MLLFLGRLKWIVLFIPVCVWGSGIYTPGTGTGSGAATLPLPPGDTNYIQNTGIPTTATQVFSVSSGTVTGDLGFADYTKGVVMFDSAHCRWRTTVKTDGTLLTSLLNCPAAGGTTGQCMGLLCSILYAN